jgi:hypothetical protein
MEWFEEKPDTTILKSASVGGSLGINDINEIIDPPKVTVAFSKKPVGGNEEAGGPG